MVLTWGDMGVWDNADETAEDPETDEAGGVPTSDNWEFSFDNTLF